ncbi:zinc ribbon domain-containing protein [Lujinxingia vulgaris]|uniref:Zinc ribbon domain-containing protein n=1 Tax=Lujinxingia vulgaris TaxID=2600176 RepID=A0A5C6XIY3_9DELT|nr:zinc ribbon domain-containing protein [Lujinxingia vulgaris]TXD37549.1 zinc ribbon domain-containing protein [Lujinxingia vulgaris]
MPIYEYRCAGCGHVFEEIQRFSDPDPEACPKCGSPQVGRMISANSFQLKGGGWYAQDYAGSSSSSSSKPSGGGGEG